jgi:hypothetical protein
MTGSAENSGTPQNGRSPLIVTPRPSPGHGVCAVGGGAGVQKPNRRDARLLRVRYNRPRRHRTAKQSDDKTLDQQYMEAQLKRTSMPSPQVTGVDEIAVRGTPIGSW